MNLIGGRLIGTGLILAMLAPLAACSDATGATAPEPHPASPIARVLPDHIVNGDFSYRSNEIIDANKRLYGGDTYLSTFSSTTGRIPNPTGAPIQLSGWDAAKEGWLSDESKPNLPSMVEVQRKSGSPTGYAGNTWGEICANDPNNAIYQDIDTDNASSTVYTVSLKLASRNRNHDDMMQVLVGPVDDPVPITMVRTKPDGSKTEPSTTLTAVGTAQDGDWAVFTGSVVVPAGQKATRFTFRSLNGQSVNNSAEGNCIDDVSFEKAYPLGYDSNGAQSGVTPQQTK